MPVISVALHLGYGFLRASLTYPIRVGRGKERFLRSYGPDGLVPATVEYRRHSAAFERCLGCGLCDLALPQPFMLSDLVGSSWRSPETWSSVSAVLDELSGIDLSRAEASCPASVPLKKLVTELRVMVRGWGEIGERLPREGTNERLHSTIGKNSETEP